jgi:LmbE family N-acetylglucosaminyl deacetylase
MNILAISAHPDDETLGCGGTLLRHQAEGHSLHWAIVTQAHSPQWPSDLIDRKAAEVEAAARRYSMQSVHRLRLPTTELDAIPFARVIDGLRAAIEQVRPDIVYLPHRGDVNTDHEVVFRAVLSVLKAFYMSKFGVSRILSFETLSSTEAAAPTQSSAFVPNVYMDITPYCDHKLEIMSLYESEAQVDPMPRGPSAIRALARFRGATVDVNYAEAFMLVREVL